MRLNDKPRLARHLIRILVALVVLGAASCTVRDRGSDSLPLPVETNLAAAELPGIAAIGGVQDVWPFSFGLDADRALVQSVLGLPAATGSRSAGGNDTRAKVVTWEYPGVSFTFFVDEAARIEDLLVARVDSSDVALRGGLAVGMTADDALALLGEPGYRAGDEVIYFYYTTTIELLVRRGRVAEIALARAMP